LEVFQSKLVLKLVWPYSVWPLLTGGHYSEVAVNTGLTVVILGAGVTFDWLFFDNSKLIDFDC
jgi:hypothetical protein